MESTFQKISRKTGKKQSFCKCSECKKQCRTSSCIPTPDDVQKLIAAGHRERLRISEWGAGVAMGVTDRFILCIAPHFEGPEGNGACTFFKDGLCELHNSGLKPTEGKLSDHNYNHRANKDPKKNLTWFVMKEWVGMTEEEIESMLNAACHE